MQSVLGYLIEPPRLVLLALTLSATFVNLRGRVRLKFGRQLTDHSTFMAPYNALIYLYSRAPTRPYLDPALFPAMRKVTDNWRVFRDEGLRLMDEGKVRAATGANDLGFHTFFKRGWKRFYLKWYDHPITSAETLCPQSAALLRSIPEVKGAMFATLPPGGRLGRHRDPFAGSVRYHLGLRTPNADGCWIEVDGVRRSWRDGEAMVFDETYVHEALNETDVTRLILFCDVERPMAGLMAPINRWFMRHVMGATGTQNEEGERIGAINRFYARIAGLQTWFKDLKERRRRLYYAQKWAGLALILGLFLAPY
ncbi:MAG TPA: aspartyl/asparaginyl beta-hydroxylase domain-containing protein [Caulobacteraceae bacterium]|nr:aspartyl/asparaginyl beta-hydroxylase domain-containing protein [Caulobacteraceae bacterium]